MKKSLTLFFITIIFLTSCTITGNVIQQDTGSVDVLFCPRDNCLEHMLDLIENSEEIKCAFYDLDIPILIDALIEKHAEVILEDKNSLDEFKTGYSFALMHNKFCIFDNHIVTTGSMNPTKRGNYYNNNNLIIIKSRKIAQNYLDEFNELESGIYGEGQKTLNTKVNVNDILIENYFCPEDNCKLQVINTLKSANKSIYFMTFSFTDEDIGNLLWNKNYQGLEVNGILEKKQISTYSRYDDLKEFSITDNNKYTMHHKVFVIDESIVITGSYNPTKNANEHNDENILIIHSKELAKKFINEFNYLYTKEKLPKNTKELILSEVLYDAIGSDKNKEYFTVTNKGNEKIILDYYFISNGKTNNKLNGTIQPMSKLKILSPISLRNSNGTLILMKNQEVIDYVKWEGVWNLTANEGQRLIRINNEKIEETSWEVSN